MTCPLCKNANCFSINEIFKKCSLCSSIYRIPEDCLSKQKEVERYKLHQNDSNNQDYQKFVLPLVDQIILRENVDSKGLDFGCGPDSAVAKLLIQQGYNIQLYDPNFFNEARLLNLTYDFVVCCEVVEHFKNPDLEFKLLRRLLKPQGKLYIMTDLLTADLDFLNWYYIRDRTHLFFYSKETFDWIKGFYQFSTVEVIDRVVVLSVVRAD